MSINRRLYDNVDENDDEDDDDEDDDLPFWHHRGHDSYICRYNCKSSLLKRNRKNKRKNE